MPAAAARCAASASRAWGPRITVANPEFDPEEDDPEEVSPTLSLPIGGRSLTEFAVEGRYRFGNYGVVAFVDAGSVSTQEYPTFDDFAWASASAVASTPISARFGSTSPRRSAGAKVSR
jgi:outer membrane protein assembly factor BamA